MRSPVTGQAPQILYVVDPAHTRQACNDLGQNVRAGSPEAAGSTIEWPSGSRGEWVRWLPYYRLSCSTGLWLSPTGVIAFCFPPANPASQTQPSRVGRSCTRVHPLSRGGMSRSRCSAGSASPRPSALGTWLPVVLSNPCLSPGDFHGG